MKRTVVHRFQEHFKKQRKIVDVVMNFDNNPDLVKVNFEGRISLLMGTAEFNKIKKDIPEDLWKKNSPKTTSADQATSTTTPQETRSSSPRTKKGAGVGRVSVQIRSTSKPTSPENEQKK